MEKIEIKLSCLRSVAIIEHARLKVYGARDGRPIDQTIRTADDFYEWATEIKKGEL